MSVGRFFVNSVQRRRHPSKITHLEFRASDLEFGVVTTSMIAKRVIFEGRVQGVGFRYAVKQLAMGFDVCGWVKNLPEGSVEMQLMGEEEEVEEFLKEIVEESAMAHNIKNMYSEKIELLENVKGFTISA